MALGADSVLISWMVLAQALRLTIAGVALGAAAGIAGARSVASLLYGVAPLDPVSIFVAAVLMLAAAGLASVVPARRATRIEPTRALRGE